MPPERSGGFTLVEVLVALVVTSLLLTIIMNGAVMAKSRMSTATAKRSALLLAQAIAAERAVAPFDAIRSTGRSGRLVWESHETPISADPRGLFALVEIDVAVRGDDETLLASLSARKLKRVGAR